MNGEELFQWLAAIPAEERQGSRVWLETPTDNEELVTAKCYDQNRDGKIDTIYLIHK